MDLPPILTDATRYQCGLTCRRKRFWAYEHKNPDGSYGLERKKLNMYRHFGIAFHRGVEQLRRGVPVDDVSASVTNWYFAEANTRGMVVEVPEDIEFVIMEQANLLDATLRAWARIRLPQIVSEFETIWLEEDQWVPIGEQAGWMFRCDSVERRRADNKLFVRNYETISDANDAWRSKFQTDLQTLSEPWAVEVKLGEPIEGVIVEGIVKGRRRKLKDGAGQVYRVYQQSKLLLGGKSATDSLSYDDLGELFQVLTIERNPYDTFNSQVVLEEKRLKGLGQSLDLWPQNFSACDEYGSDVGRCEYHSFCWSGESEDYIPRIPNHSVELKCQLQSSSS